MDGVLFSMLIFITGILNEQYDDWYDDSDDEFGYEDNDGISGMLEEACDFVHIMRRRLPNAPRQCMELL